LDSPTAPLKGAALGLLKVLLWVLQMVLLKVPQTEQRLVLLSARPWVRPTVLRTVRPTDLQ